MIADKRRRDLILIYYLVTQLFVFYYYFISILYLMWLYSKKQEWCRYLEINIFLINYTIYN